MKTDKCKKLIEDEFNKFVCNKTISDFKLDFDNDADENCVLTVNAQIRLKKPVRYYTIKESNFPELSHDEFIEMCNKIKEEINNNIQNELEKEYEKKKLYERTQYRDQIWKIYDDDSEELIWENSWRDECWYGDNNPDSEYHKMMELEQETDFFHKWEELNWWFEHRVVQRDIYGEEKYIKYYSLLEEFIDT